VGNDVRQQLGPFVLFTNDLCNMFDYDDYYVMYADDVTL
jgi:hypothetical protein